MKHVAILLSPSGFNNKISDFNKKAGPFLTLPGTWLPKVPLFNNRRCTHTKEAS